ncbi:MAG: ABC transporter permease subunit [Firmicutes bacterium]|nr:ABC transporter permease subunit [Bacillota bacterium]
MKNFFRIMKKELYRVFKDPRMIIVLIMPGILIYALYSLMGGAMANQTNEEKAKADTYIIYTVNMPEPIKDIIEEAGYKFQYENKTTEYDTMTDSEKQTMQDLLKTGDADLILIFSDGFISEIGSIPPPDIKVYYNPYESKSSFAKNLVDSTINSLLFETEITPIFDEKKASGEVISMILPMILIAFLFSGCIAVTPESIAGEKERGTMATLLSTPVKRSEIAIGKISALSLLALISAVSSFVGLVFSLPSLLGLEVGIFSIYGFADMLLLFLIIASTVLVIVGIMAVLSAFSKSVKEATLYATPFMILSMVTGLLVMFTGVPSSFFYYLIPLFNTSASIASVLSSNINVLNLTITVVSNIVYVAALIYLMTRIFNSEKVMFSK